MSKQWTGVDGDTNDQITALQQATVERLHSLIGHSDPLVALEAVKVVISTWGVPKVIATPHNTTSVADAQKATVINALAATGGIRKETALLLGIGERTLYRWIKKHNL